VGWFIRNLRDIQWFDSPFGLYCDFEQGERFPEVGVNLGIVQPGQPVALYHREDHQEGFLVLAGECIVIVEGEELPLRQWDYFHSPAGVAHVLVGAGEGPAFVLAVGGRVGPANLSYPVEPLALKHGAGVKEETTKPAEAYAPYPEPQPISFRPGFLPDLPPP
jgi:uncharacterized cupin superfamily protein